MKKVIEKIRIITFVITLLTTIPLFVNYLRNIEPTNELIIHLHVWFGTLFFVSAVINMIINKQNRD
jgi:hypothetical protein